VKSTGKFVALSLTLAGFLLAGTAANANPLSVSITLASPNQTTFTGGTLTFDATVTNTGGATVFLNGDSATVDAPLTLDDSPFLANFPSSLIAGDSATGTLFTVFVPGGAAGIYTGSFTIEGGADGSALGTLGSADFTVTTIPEPSGLLLMGSGILVLGLLAGRKLLG